MVTQPGSHSCTLQAQRNTLLFSCTISLVKTTSSNHQNAGFPSSQGAERSFHRFRGKVELRVSNDGAGKARTPTRPVPSAISPAEAPPAPTDTAGGRENARGKRHGISEPRTLPAPSGRGARQTQPAKAFLGFHVVWNWITSDEGF